MPDPKPGHQATASAKTPALASLLMKGRTGKDRPSAMPGIYAIVVTKDQGERPVVYIGKSSNTSMRWARHRKDLREGKHHHKVLQAAWPDVHFYVLEYTFEIDVREVFWIDFVAMLKCNIINERRG